MLRAFCVVVLAWLSSACAQPAYGQYQRLINESVQLVGQGRYAEAVETAERALKSAEETLGPEHPGVATALNNLAEFHQMAAFVSKDQAALAKAAATAEPLHKRALAIREKALGLRHSFTLTSMINLAKVYSLQRRYDDAEALYKRAQSALNEISTRAPVLVDLDRQAATGLSQIDRVRSQIEASAESQATTEKSYANPNHRWSISYPSNWKLDDKNSSSVKFTKRAATLGIHTFTDVAGKTADEVTDALLQRWERNMQNVNVYTQVSRRRVILPGDLTAIEVVHHIGKGVVGKSRKVVAIVKDRAFWIDAETGLESWPDYERDFDRIIESFKAQE